MTEREQRRAEWRGAIPELQARLAQAERALEKADALADQVGFLWGGTSRYPKLVDALTAYRIERKEGK